MTKYQIADGWNNTGGLADLIVQPATPSRIEVPDRNYSADGLTTPAGEPYVDLIYTILSNDEFPALNTQIGVSLLVPDNLVTIKVRKDDGTFGNYNGIIHYPDKAQHVMAGWKATYRVNLKESL